MNAYPPPPGPPAPHVKKPMPWWAIVLIVLGGLLGLGVLGIVVLLGLVAFACSRH
jgi:hypothetical protein